MRKMRSSDKKEIKRKRVTENGNKGQKETQSGRKERTREGGERQGKRERKSKKG